MILLNRLEEKNIYSFTIKGDINKEDAEDFYKLLEESADKNQKVKLLGVINEYPDFKDFKAFSETMKMKTKAINNIGKYAVLSDKDWVESVMPVGNFLTPGIPIKHFNLDERDEAITWLEKEETKTFKEEEYLSKMDVRKIKDTNIYSFTVNGKIDEGGMTALYNIMKDKSHDNKIRLLGYYKNFDGFDSFKAFINSMKVDFASFNNLDRFAIITDKKWVNTLAEIESKIIPGISIKGFTENEKESAIDWLKEK